ncbi:MAG TPA: beta-ketoacyl synthase chain length factor [Holophagaceae bacterium]|nr:beta-ketoacyl synthase chain length factor [Holophagaceae bacterium]
MSIPEFSIPITRAAFWSQEPLPGVASDPFLDTASGPPDTAFIEPLLRRRLSALGRGMLHCAGRVAADVPELRSVFASQHGEPSRTMPMLEDLAHGLDISPTQFSMNVHNAVAGIWSISRQDSSACTALGAGPETFGWGLLEAYSLHRSHGGAPVLFVYGDDRLPEVLTEFEPMQAPLHALAFLIAAPAARQLRIRRDPSVKGAAAAQSLRCLAAMANGPANTGAWAWTWV